jgi:hypothetical protein
MSRVQKFIAAITLLAVALFLHSLLCDWYGPSGIQYDSFESRSIMVRIGSAFVITAISYETLAFDGVVGIAVPMLLVGTPWLWRWAHRVCGWTLVAMNELAFRVSGPPTRDSSLEVLCDAR